MKAAKAHITTVSQLEFLRGLYWVHTCGISCMTVFRLNLPQGVKIVSSADDIAVIVVAKHIHEIEQAAIKAIWKIKSWLGIAGLGLADHKTKAVLIASWKTLEYFKVQVGS